MRPTSDFSSGSPGNGGNGGGGNGGGGPSGNGGSGYDGINGTGGGGGGVGALGTATANSRYGGSGIVIIRYLNYFKDNIQVETIEKTKFQIIKL